MNEDDATRREHRRKTSPSNAATSSDAAAGEFAATGQASTPMFELLEATDGNVVAVRMDAGTPDGYRAFYERLTDRTTEYGTVHVYEETTDWTLATYLSHLYGLVPDLRTGPKLNIGRYAAVGNSHWAKCLFRQWQAIAPVWPVAPDKMRYYDRSERATALDWVAGRTAATAHE